MRRLQGGARATMAKRLILSIVALASACMSPTDFAVVERAAAQFHDLQARGDDNAIYQAASPELRASSRLEDLTRIGNAVRNIRGCQAPARDPNTWNNNIDTSGHFITVVYNRQCADGPLVETFVFRVTGQQALLAGYHASGMALFPASPPSPATTAPAKPRHAPTRIIVVLTTKNY